VKSELEANELWSVDLSADRRSAAWQALLLGGLTDEPLEAQDVYRGLSQMPCSYDEVIRRDVGRTLPQEELFRGSLGKGQTALFRVLHALAVQHGDIGYVQSLNFIVATIINVFPDDEALVFSCARSLLFRHSLVDFYRPSFPKLGVTLWQFDRLVEGFLPKAHAALDAHGISAEFYAMQWFLTLFASDLPQKVVVRIWDRFLLVGWQVIVQVALALIADIQDELWEVDSCSAMELLKKFTHTRRFEAEALLEAASKFDVSHRMLSDLEAAYDRGEDAEGTKLTVEKNLDTGASTWSVQRRVVSKMCRSNSSRSVGSSSEALPRAFDQGLRRDSSRSVGSSSEARQASSPSSSGSSRDRADSAQGTCLPFMIHNLDTGETTLLEDEWTEYMRIRQQHTSPEVSPALRNHHSWQTDWPNPFRSRESPGRLGGACGGSFWVQEQQLQALRTLGKA